MAICHVYIRSTTLASNLDASRPDTTYRRPLIGLMVGSSIHKTHLHHIRGTPSRIVRQVPLCYTWNQRLSIRHYCSLMIPRPETMYRRPPIADYIHPISTIHHCFLSTTNAETMYRRPLIPWMANLSRHFRTPLMPPRLEAGILSHETSGTTQREK